MFRIFVFSILIGLVSISCKKDLLVKAKNKLNRNGYVSYNTIRSSNDPLTEEINSTYGFIQIKKNKESIFNYDFLIKTRRKFNDVVLEIDNMFTNNIYQTLYHNSQEYVNHPSFDRDKMQPKQLLTNTFISNSPNSYLNECLTFLDPSLPMSFKVSSYLDNNWEYKQDTLIDQKSMQEYTKILVDEASDGSKVLVTNHLFINTKTYLVELWTREVMVDNEPGQKLTQSFSDYRMGVGKEIGFTIPENYRLKAPEEKLALLKPEDKAPVFELTDINGEVVKLSDYEGKKVLLDFSVIGCGVCKMTLDHFNSDDFKLSKNIEILYLNLEDSPEKLRKYTKKIEMSFPVLPNAKEVGKNYGVVSSYPVFFLINEKGVIEKTQFGYDKIFLNSLQEN